MPLGRALRLIAMVLGVLVVIGARPDPAASTVAVGLTGDTSPADGETVTASPAQLSLVFTVGLDQAPGIVLQTADSSPVTTVGEVVRGDGAEIWYLPIATPLPAGVYTVTWSEAGGSAGRYTFTVGSVAAGGTATTAPAAVTGTDPAATTTPTAATAATESSPETAKAVNVVARWLSYLAIGSLFGGLLVIALVWGEGVEYVLTLRFLRTTWVVAVLATVLNMACSRAIAAEASLAGSFNPATWTDLTDDLAGLAMLGRFVLVLASAWVVFGPERAVDEATQIPALLAPAVAVVTFGFTRAADGIDLLLTPASIIHVLGFAAWFGGLVILWRVVLAGSGEQDLVDAVRGFGRIATPALLAVVVSGVLLTARLVGGASNLFTTGYGRLLLFKTLGVAAMAFIGVINRQTVQLRLVQAKAMPARTASRLRRALGSEMAAGLVVLGFTGWMVGSVPEGLPESAGGSSVEITEEFELTNSSGLTVVLGVGPQVVGPNDVRIIVERPASGLVEMQVRLDPLDAYVESIVIDVVPALTGQGTLVVEGPPLNAAGRWKATITGRDVDGDLGTLETEFVVAAAPGDDTTSDTTTSTVG